MLTNEPASARPALANEDAAPAVPCPNPDVIAKRLDDATVLVHIPTSRIFELNRTGTRVWELLGEGLDAEAIVSRLIADYEVEEAQAAGEVRTLIETLEREGLLST